MPETHWTRKEGQPYRPPAQQAWATGAVQEQNEEALYAFGELALFTLMWRPKDHEAGLVARCSTCFTGAQSRQAEAFKQPTRRECPDCFGTTFEGGFRAQIIRPALWADRNAEDTDQHRGVVVSETLNLETTGDFTLRKNDYVFRFDNTRYQVEAKTEVVLRTGFHSPETIQSFAGQTTARRENEGTVAFLIPPTDPELVGDVLGTLGGSVLPDLNLLSLIRPGGYLVEGQPVPAHGGGVSNIVTGHGPPSPTLVVPAGSYYLDLDTGILYEAAP
jgi:hypothetical protein